MQLCNAMSQAYVRVHITIVLSCVHFCAREKKTGSKFDLLSEVIFKDLAVPAVTVKLTIGSWFVVAEWPCFTDTGIRRQVM